VAKEFKIYNTLTRKVETFVPLEEGKVKMYVCGVTAYDSPHLGHARSAVIFDALYRFLKFLGYEVTYVRNITDIDDKVINRSQKEGIPWRELVERCIKEYNSAMEKLGVLKPDFEPRATEHIPEIISLIEKIMERGYAYESRGDVYFEVEKFPSYGKLSGRKIEELKAGVRIEVSEKKRHPLDFALWKSAKPGEPFWESPWGKGRPGWHIECSAMSMKYLGETLDIHGGGLDLIFPHHENEIAQSESATGKPFVRYFVHHGLITVEGEKMSKSLGNFVTMDYLLNKFHPEVIRTFLLSKHYRSPLDYSEEKIKETEKAVYHLYETLYWLKKAVSKGEGLLSERGRKLEKALIKFEEEFINALLEDFNTALAIGHLFNLINDTYNFLGKQQTFTSEEVLLLERVEERIKELSGKILGIGAQDVFSFWKTERERKLKEKGKSLEEVEALVKKRSEARKEKNFEVADKIRDELKQLGIVLKDTRVETFWYIE
jgi:cysteinyl-tRNA synthetase